MLGCKFSFDVEGENIKEKATKCSFKTNEVLLNADGHKVT